ncbi:hypothetical protein NDU88_001086 [Pleurodeles waltl]|uniref:Uncharacterized protein n=1 Tax=Pleurodeles waltl TaxID=8319 RepID=A0AAV7Q5X1_PLEWA|nr:hypothetical protein NDU88_001086 [Pleurodeles waltl]
MLEPLMGVARGGRRFVPPRRGGARDRSSSPSTAKDQGGARLHSPSCGEPESVAATTEKIHSAHKSGQGEEKSSAGCCAGRKRILAEQRAGRGSRGGLSELNPTMELC